VLAWRARRELADRAPAGGALAAELAALCAAQRERPPRLTVAPGLSGPISLPNREIVLPPWAVDALDPRRRRAMLAHELAHHARRDPLWLVARSPSTRCCGCSR
jgi:Zn-dependent protease with chaperone function